MTLHFIKYHGLGNDFAIFEGGLAGRPAFTPAEVRRLCHRGVGVGADGVVLARLGTGAPLRMELTNSDGSVPEMCGNGIRCFVKYAIEELRLEDNPLSIQTLAGVRTCAWRAGVDGSVVSVRVDMGVPAFERPAIPMAGQGPSTGLEVIARSRAFEADGVSTGNPHMIIFGDASSELACEFGSTLTHHPLWPEGANVAFTEVLTPDRLRVTVWERGCGLTQASGTAATAATAAAVRRGLARAGAPVKVELPGGALFITIDSRTGRASMQGPVEEVYRGVLHHNGP